MPKTFAYLAKTKNNQRWVDVDWGQLELEHNKTQDFISLFYQLRLKKDN